jgi:hypothetical protein
MTTSRTELRQAETRPQLTVRLHAMAAAVLAPAVTWLLIEMAGVDLRSPGFEGNPQGFEINLLAVVVASGLASLAAWALLLLTTRWSQHPRRIWMTFAILGFVLSLGGPFTGTGIDTADRWLLALLHVVTAAVLIPLMSRTIPTIND